MDNYYYYQVNGCCAQPIYIRQPKAIVIHSQQRQMPLTLDIPPQNIIVKNDEPQSIIVRQQSPNVVIQNAQSEKNDIITEHTLQTTTASIPQFDGPALGSCTGTANVIQSMNQTQQIQALQPPIQPVTQPAIQSTIQSIIQPTMQPNIQSAIQPTIQSTIQPTMQSTMQSTIQAPPSMQNSQPVQQMQHMYAQQQQQQLQHSHPDAGYMYQNPNMMYGNVNNSMNPYMYPNSYYPMQNMQMTGNLSDTGMGMGMVMGLGPGQGQRNKMDMNNIEMNDINAYVTAPLHNMNYKQMPTDYEMHPSPVMSLPMQHMDPNYSKVYDPNSLPQYNHQYTNRNNGPMHFS